MKSNEFFYQRKKKSNTIFAKRKADTCTSNFAIQYSQNITVIVNECVNGLVVFFIMRRSKFYLRRCLNYNLRSHAFYIYIYIHIYFVLIIFYFVQFARYIFIV